MLGILPTYLPACLEVWTKIPACSPFLHQFLSLIATRRSTSVIRLFMRALFPAYDTHGELVSVRSRGGEKERLDGTTFREIANLWKLVSVEQVLRDETRKRRNATRCKPLSPRSLTSRKNLPEANAVLVITIAVAVILIPV